VQGKTRDEPRPTANTASRRKQATVERVGVSKKKHKKKTRDPNPRNKGEGNLSGVKRKRGEQAEDE